MAAEDYDQYMRWHLLDHMPEQYQLPGLVHAQRWIADNEYVTHRIEAAGPFTKLGNVVNYLVGDPVQQTHDDFMELGTRLEDAGRFPIYPRSIQLRMPALLRWYAAPAAQISPEVVPFRPHRGVLLLVEEPARDEVATWLQWLHAEHFPRLLDQPGVAGAWMYGTTNTWKLHPRCEGPAQYTTVIYLDDDPLATIETLRSEVESRWESGAARALFAGPLRTMTAWEAWPEPSGQFAER